MKFKTTKKAITEGYRHVICTGYCTLQALLSYENPVAYTCGRDGWNADIYQVNNVAIVTGYRPFGTIRPGYEMNKQYDDKAQAIRSSDLPWEEQRDQIRKLLSDYVTEALKPYYKVPEE